MKAKKLLSLFLVLTLAVIPFCLPVSAAQGTGKTFDELTSIAEGIKLSAYGTPTVDGTRDDVYAEHGCITSNYTGNKVDPTSFEAYYANDSEYLYVHLTVSIYIPL